MRDERLEFREGEAPAEPKPSAARFPRPRYPRGEGWGEG
jgi:hypothetical protein